MISDMQKFELIEQLEIEKERLSKKGYDTTDHDYSIEYLKTGHTNGEIGENELLMACINDIDCLYTDYCS